MIDQVVQHGVRCPGCSRAIYSNSGRDFVSCGCSLETFIDGGFEYQRIGTRGDVTAIVGVKRTVDRACLPAYFAEER